MASVVGVFFVPAIVGDPADDFFWIVTPGESAFRVRPIVFRLAQRARL
jgi:hypothetical protein